VPLTFGLLPRPRDKGRALDTCRVGIPIQLSASGGIPKHLRMLNEKVMTTCADQGRRPAESGLDFPP
jgi:hypothetical protein